MRPAAALAIACLAILALARAAAAQAPPPKPARVTVNDFYFGPETVTIVEGAAVNWVWSETNSAPHDVHLKSGPRGLTQRATYSTKTTAVTDAKFKKVFTTPGTYKFICTVHPTQMHLTVVVKK